MKKTQGLSINVIVIVAIALIVLVVLIAIFTGRMGGFVEGIEETTTCDVACQGLGKAGTVEELPTGTVKETATCTDGDKLRGPHSDVSDTELCCCT